MLTDVETASEWLFGKLVSNMKIKEYQDHHGWKSKTQENWHMDNVLLLSLMMELLSFRLLLFLSTSALPTTLKVQAHWPLTRVTMLLSIF